MDLKEVFRNNMENMNSEEFIYKFLRLDGFSGFESRLLMKL